MAGVKGSFLQSFNLTQSGTNDLGAPCMDVDGRSVLTLTEGTLSTGQADALFSDQRDLVAAADEDLDLSGALNDAFGVPFAPEEIVAIYVRASDTNTDIIELSVPAANGFNGPFRGADEGVAINPGDVFMAVSKDGWPVTDATADLLNVSNPGAAVASYDIVLAGRTTAA